MPEVGRFKEETRPLCLLLDMRKSADSAAHEGREDQRDPGESRRLADGLPKNTYP